ncbi:MAG: hypothetical protein K9H15_05060 [Bacteroidales bacterium]|nr:hypothetical protein [Bacteroidales bacterium]
MATWRDYENTPTIELINFIKMKGDTQNREIAELAFSAFYFRFYEKIAKKAEYVCKNNGYDSILAVEVIDKTFQNFFKYPEFSPDKMKTTTIDKGVEVYLSRIAQNAYTDLIKERNGLDVSPYSGDEQIIHDIPVPDDSVDIDYEKYVIIRDALKTFSWKHKVIYLTYLQYEKDGYKLPRKLLSELRSKLDITQDTVRSYRYEVIKKIKEYTKIWQQRNQIPTKI